PPGTGCRCGKEGCAWHARSGAGCGGQAGRQVILHDAAGGLWRLAEVCGPCADAIPDARPLRPLNSRRPAADGPSPLVRGGCRAEWSSGGSLRPPAG
ncbi:hypothetical protein J7E86_27285, partial [Streptomyces sp. ISL-11]|nr:hypothetical protein [Streptomyces sp. ISL-11]